MLIFHLPPLQSVDFHTHNKSKTYERVLCEQKRRGSEFQDTLQVFPIVVPSVTPSYLQFCEIIDISYKVEVRIVYLYEFCIRFMLFQTVVPTDRF